MKFSENGSFEGSENEVTVRSPMLSDTSETNFDLSVLKGIVEAHKGTILTKPDSQNSVFFEIRLPLSG